MATLLKKVREVVLIDKIKAGFKPKSAQVVVSIGDDAAVVRGPEGRYLLYTADMLIEGVHFKKDEDPAKVGYKAVAVSVSDIAAMGGVPKYALISVGLAKNGLNQKAQALYKGIKACCDKFGVDVIGGDTNKSDKLVIDCSLIGEVKKKDLVLRSEAKSGDYIFVTGALGGSIKGGHLSFVPRVEESRFLVNNLKLNSMIDLSDGLGMDLNRVCEASGCGAFIFEDHIPKNKGVKRTDSALFDGEDFELLFTLSKPMAFKLMRLQNKGRTKFRFFHIGRITDLFKGVRMADSSGNVREISCESFKHF